MKDLSATLAAHAAWLRDPATGARADLRGADLRGADLRGADLRGADLRGVNLIGADLRDANLRDANLRFVGLTGARLNGAKLDGADLRGVTGDGVVIQSIHLPRYPVAITRDSMQIGCQRHPIADWLAFDDETIARMDSGALDWWRRWKPTIASAIAARQ